jgi:acyl-CoA thioesterase
MRAPNADPRPPTPDDAERRMSEDPQSRAERLVAAMLAKDAFTRWLGAEVVAVAPGSCTTRMTVRPEMVNGFGVAHGAIAFALADSAMAFACNGHGTVTVSIENSVTYPAAVRVGDVLTARCEREAESGKLGYYRAPVTNQHGETVALFRGTVYRTQKELRSE